MFWQYDREAKTRESAHFSNIASQARPWRTFLALIFSDLTIHPENHQYLMIECKHFPIGRMFT